jgi:membrane glycosyltransferase
VSVAIETVSSALFAPIRMLFHTEFVVTGVAGIQLRWKSPPRDDAETSWGQALRRHSANTAMGLAWIALVWYMDPRVLPWILPVAGALVVSIPLSVITSRVGLGRRARAANLFLTPEESAPPEEIRRTMELARAASRRPGLAEAVVDPLVNALACAQATARWHAPASARADREALVHLALTLGLDALDRTQKNRLLNDPIALSALHLGALRSPHAHASWVNLRA